MALATARLIGPAPFPWVTAAVAVASAAIFLLPGAADTFVYDRAALSGGQLWRLWTAHLVHFNASHLGWNLAVWLAAGAWLERLAPRASRWFCAGASPVIAGTLLLFAPQLAHYGGLSGLAAGLVVLLALQQLSAPGEARWIWSGVIAFVALKIAVEWWSGTPYLAAGIHSAPIAHLAGVACAGVARLIARNSERRQNV